MGILLDAYGRPAAITTAYNPPYYQRLLESAGLTKAKTPGGAVHRPSRSLLDRPSCLARAAVLVRRRYITRL